MATTSTTPTRFDASLFEAAQAAGARSHRSAAQQLAHWARLGRELEASAGVSQRDIDRVLAGQLPYDTLGDRDQAIVRTAWAEGIDADLTGLDLRAHLDGRTRISEADADGAVTVHTPTPAPGPDHTSRTDGSEGDAGPETPEGSEGSGAFPLLGTTLKPAARPRRR